MNWLNYYYREMVIWHHVSHWQNNVSYVQICGVYRKKGANNTIVRDYVLPDYTHIKRGHVRMPGEASSGTEQVANSLRFHIVNSVYILFCISNLCSVSIPVVFAVNFFVLICSSSFS